MSPALDVDRIIEMLIGKLQAEERPGGDHRFFIMTINGKIVARTKISRGSGYKTYPPNLVSQVAKRLWVTTPHSSRSSIARCLATHGSTICETRKGRRRCTTSASEK